MPVLVGTRVLLRQIVASDFPKLVQWSRDAELNRLIDGNYPESLEECPDWFRRFASSRHALRLGIGLRTPSDEALSPLIGDIELDHITWRSGDAELRIRIGEKHCWNCGFGTEAVSLLLEHAFSQMKLKRVYLRVYRFNTRAIRCYEKCGFRKEGRIVRPSSDGQLHEVLLMRILREEHLQRRQLHLPPAS